MKKEQLQYARQIDNKQIAQRRETEQYEQYKEYMRKKEEEEALNKLAEELEIESRQREERRKEEMDTFDDTKLANVLKIKEERERNKSFIDEVGSAFTKVGQKGVSFIKGIGNGFSSLWKGGSRSSLRNRRQKKRISKKRNFRRKM